MERIYVPRHRIDVLEAAKLTVSAGKQRYIVLSVARGFLAGSLFYIFWPLGFEPRGLVSLILGLVVALLSYLVVPSQLAKIYARPNQALAFSDRTLTLDGAGLKAEYTVGMVTFFPWKVFIRSKWLKEFVLLYITDLQYVTIPRQVLTQEAEEAIRQGLGKGTGTTASLLP